MTLAQQGYKAFCNELPPKHSKINVIWVNGQKGDIDLRYISLNLDAHIYPLF